MSFPGLLFRELHRMNSRAEFHARENSVISESASETLVGLPHNQVILSTDLSPKVLKVPVRINTRA